MSTPRPVLLMNSILAGVTFIGGGAVLTEVIPPVPLGLGLLVLGGIQIGWSTYVQGRVVPLENTAAYKSAQTGNIVAGPAAPGVTSKAAGSTNLGDVVDVTKATAWETP